MPSLPTILLILAALGMGATVVAIIISFRSQREAQSAIFPIVREQEAVRAQRARLSIFVWIAVTALFLGGWLATLRLESSADSGESIAANNGGPTEQPVEAAIVVETDTPVPTVEPTSTAQAQPLQPAATDTNTPLPAVDSPTSPPNPTETFTPVPSSTFTSTPQPTPTATPTPTAIPPTATPTATSTPVPINTPTPIGGIPVVTSAPRTPAPPGARMGPIQFAEDVTEELEPINPAESFPNGIAAIYAIYPFSGMQKGVDFAAVWYKNGEEIARDEGEWQYGEQAKSFSFLVPRGEGLYKLELYVNDTVMVSDLFEVR